LRCRRTTSYGRQQTISLRRSGELSIMLESG
jgi:hypothetical protein